MLRPSMVTSAIVVALFLSRGLLVAQAQTPSYFITDLGTLGGNWVIAFGINDRGQVVGRSIATNGEDHAFLWSKGVMLDLNDAIPGGSGWTLTEAASINDSSQIVGFGIVNRQTHAFLLTPNED